MADVPLRYMVPSSYLTLRRQCLFMHYERMSLAKFISVARHKGFAHQARINACPHERGSLSKAAKTSKSSSLMVMF